MKSVNFDWIGFTFNVDVPLDHVLDVFLGDLVLNEVGHGRLGYRNMMTDPDACVFLLYNGNDNMGVHLDFPATGVAVFFDCVVEYERWRRGAERDLIDVSDMTRSANLYHALSFMLEFGHFTRLDVAMDDEEDPAFTPAELDRYWDAGQIVTYCRSHKFVKTEGGDTFYLGSRQSCIMLRVYDKGAQMKAGRPWIRWEFEIKSPEYTGLFIQRFGECESLSVLFISYLDRFMRIVSPDGAARPVDRRPLRKWLISIIGSKRFRIRPLERKFTIPEKVLSCKYWVEKFVAPTIRRVGIYEQGYEWLYSMLDFSKCTYDDFVRYDRDHVFIDLEDLDDA